jgi:hypothetical protein
MGLAADRREVSELICARHPGCDPDALYAEWTSGIATAFARGPATRWAGMVARALLGGADLGATVQQARVQDPSVGDTDLRVIEELHRSLARTPVLDELINVAPAGPGTAAGASLG